MNKKQHEALKLVDKTYLNSYECMWNDAMIHLHQNIFYMNLGLTSDDEVDEVKEEN